MKIYIDTTADPKNALIAGQADNQAANMPTLFFGDVLPLQIMFTDGAGNLAEFSGQANNEIIFAIGNIVPNQSYAKTESFSYANNCYIADLNLNTIGLETALANIESVNLTFEIQVNNGQGQSTTFAQGNVTVRNQLNLFSQVNTTLPNEPSTIIAVNTAPTIIPAAPSTIQISEINTNQQDAPSAPSDITTLQNVAYIVYGDDGNNGLGYYYPLYLYNFGLGQYHTHNFGDRIVTASWENAGKTTIVGEFLKILQTQENGGRQYRRSDGSKIWSNANQHDNSTTAAQIYYMANADFNHATTYPTGTQLEFAPGTQTETFALEPSNIQLLDITNQDIFPTQKSNGSTTGNLVFEDEGLQNPQIQILTTTPPNNFTTNQNYEATKITLLNGTVTRILLKNNNNSSVWINIDSNFVRHTDWNIATNVLPTAPGVPIVQDISPGTTTPSTITVYHGEGGTLDSPLRSQTNVPTSSGEWTEIYGMTYSNGNYYRVHIPLPNIANTAQFAVTLTNETTGNNSGLFDVVIGNHAGMNWSYTIVDGGNDVSALRGRTVIRINWLDSNGDALVNEAVLRLDLID
tara:strand:+ start:16997 stop:18724 length:1728 start_codon:yes stop_codon:yes gene_type:complete